MADEVGNPAMIMTVAGLEKKMTAAATTVVAGMKAETARVM